MGIVDWANVQRLKAGLLTTDERTIRDAWVNMPAHIRQWQQVRDAADSLRVKMPSPQWLDLDDKIETARIQLARVNTFGLEAVARARADGALDGLGAWEGVVIAVTGLAAAVALAFLIIPTGAAALAVAAALATLAAAVGAIGWAISQFGGKAGETIKEGSSALVLLGVLALAGYALSKKKGGW